MANDRLNLLTTVLRYDVKARTLTRLDHVHVQPYSTSLSLSLQTFLLCMRWKHSTKADVSGGLNEIPEQTVCGRAKPRPNRRFSWHQRHETLVGQKLGSILLARW
jgi:hypothetical protein